MWSTLSYSRWIVLLSLALVMLLAGSEVESSAAIINLPCCHKATRRAPAKITECYEQKSRWGCKTHAFVITDDKKQIWCVKPSKRLSDRIKKEQLKCPPDISLLH